MGGRLAEHVAHGAALPAEVEEGNVEYKYRIRRAGDARLHELATQLRWRLAEAGDATYMLGVEDDGSVPGIRADALAESLEALEAMCAIAGARLAHVERVRVCRRPELWAAEVLGVDAATHLRRLAEQATDDGRVNFRPDVYGLDGTDFIFGQPQPKTY